MCPPSYSAAGRNISTPAETYNGDGYGLLTVLASALAPGAVVFVLLISVFCFYQSEWTLVRAMCHETGHCTVPVVLNCLVTFKTLCCPLKCIRFRHTQTSRKPITHSSNTKHIVKCKPIYYFWNQYTPRNLANSI